MKRENTKEEVAPLAQFVGYFLRLGAVGFGGPIVLASHMESDLVETKRWISREDYLEGLAFSQLAPGPLAAQLAMYLGWIRGGILGATLVGFAFILPSFLMVLALAELYVRFGGLAWMQAVFYGIGAAVIAIIVQSAHKLTKRTLGKDRLLWAVFAVNAVVTAWTETELVPLFVGCGVLTVVVRGSIEARAKRVALGVVPGFVLTGIHGVAPVDILAKVGLFFAKAGAFVFGSGLAIVPFLHGSIVRDLQWLDERQFLDAVAVAMITPGPVVITVAFIGYLVAGLAGSVAAAVGVFMPVYLFVVVLSPYYHRFAKSRRVKAFVSGITAAAVGGIAGAAIVLGRKSIVDWPTAAIAVVALGLLYSKKRIPEPVLIGLAGVVGLLLKAH